MIDDMGSLTDNRANDACSQINAIVRNLLRELFAEGMTPMQSRALIDVVCNDIQCQAACERLHLTANLYRKAANDTVRQDG
ncbi:MAG: hypothetical protein AMS22_06360 [Thiotrichales bacterium SG8_50]|nr:MAG: hypothetical protein AMS22_06360 [Thiotrichales bacterium SG8_50]